MTSETSSLPASEKSVLGWRMGFAWSLICLIYLCGYFGPGLVRDDIFTNDMAEWTSWAYHFRDSALLATDPNRAYWVANFPLAYRTLLMIVSPVVDPQLFGEMLGLAMGAAVAFLAYRLGRQLCDGRVAGGIAVLLMVMLGQISSFMGFNVLNREAGGLPRSFALPLVMLGVIAVFRRNWPAMGLCFLLGALFYPPTCIMLGTYSGIVLASDVIRTRRRPRGFWLFVALAAVAGALFVGISIQSGATTGPLFTLHQMMSMAEYWPGGSSPFFYERWSHYVLAALMLDGSYPSMVWLMMVVGTLVVGFVRRDGRVTNAAFWALPISAVINYAAAYALMLRLFEPSRYLLFPYQALSLCCVAMIGDAVFRWLAPKLSIVTASPKLRGSAMVVGLWGLALVGTVGLAARVHLGLGGQRDTMPGAVYERLRTLPADTVIASLPADGDRITMRSQRSVMLMNASFFPYHPDYYGPNLRKLDAVMGALYDPTPRGAIALRDDYRIRYLIVDRGLGRSDPLLKKKPFERSFARWQKRLDGRAAYVLAPPPGVVVFREDDYALLDLSRVEPVGGR